MADYNVIVTVLAEDDIENEQNLDAFLAKLEDARKAIPAEYRGAAVIEFITRSVDDWCASDVDMRVRYTRPETPEEQDRRERLAKAQALAAEQRRAEEQKRAWEASFWADCDPVNYAKFTAVMRDLFPDVHNEGALRQAFHHRVDLIRLGGDKPSWWVDQTETAEG